MKHLSIKDLQGKQRQRWADARKVTYRKVLRDPGTSDHQKQDARLKLAAIEKGSR